MPFRHRKTLRFKEPLELLSQKRDRLLLNNPIEAFAGQNSKSRPLDKRGASEFCAAALGSDLQGNQAFTGSCYKSPCEIEDV
jgi:hypothetical protein